MKRYLVAIVAAAVSLTVLTGCPFPAAVVEDATQGDVTDSASGQNVPDNGSNTGGTDNANDNNGGGGGNGTQTGGAGTDNVNTGGNGGSNPAPKPIAGTWAGPIICSAILNNGGSPVDVGNQNVTLLFDANGTPQNLVLLSEDPSKTSQFNVQQVGATTTINSTSGAFATTTTVTVREVVNTDTTARVILDFTSIFDGVDIKQTRIGSQTYNLTVLTDSKLEYKTESVFTLSLEQTLNGVAVPPLNVSYDLDCTGILVKQ